MEDFEVTLQDSGETIIVQPRGMLNHVEKTVLERLRPTKFREILQVDSSVPEWAEGYEYDIVQGTAQWVPVEELTDEFAGASIRISKEGGKLLEFASGYTYRDREMARAQKLGIQLDTMRAEEVMKKAETVLDWLAMNGTLNGVKSAGPTIKGLYNQAGITPFADPSVVTTSYEALFAAANTADLMDAAVEKMVDDALLIEIKSETDTKETAPIDKLVYPLTFKKFMTKAKTRSSDDTAQALILKRATHIKSIVFNNKAETLGASNKRRIVGLRSNDLEAARFILAKDPVPGQAFRTRHGTEVPLSMVAGGFNTKIPASIVYVDSAVAPG